MSHKIYLKLKEGNMFLQIIKVVPKNGKVTYTLRDSNPLSNIITRGKDFGFAVTAIPNHFFKQVQECLSEKKIEVPPLIYEFSVKKTKTGFDYIVTF